MKGVIAEPTRLRDRHDQANLIERIAGQAARDSVEPAPLSKAVLARIAMDIDASRDRYRRPSSLTWALVTGAFVLGIVTAASAAHLDLLPRWLASFIPGAAKHASGEAAPATRQRRAPARLPAPTSSVPPVAEQQPEAPAATNSEPAGPEAMPAPEHPVPAFVPHKPRRVALLADLPPKPPSGATAPRPALIAPGAAAPPAAEPALGERPEPTVSWALPSAGPAEQPSASPSLRETTPSAPPRPLPPAEASSSSPRMAVLNPSAARPSTPTRAESPSTRPQAAGLLREIVRALRVAHAPRRALALLDKHGRELASQDFAEESLLLRVEAMLALGERAAVLRLLDQTSLADLSVSRTLFLTRGELRAAANRCAEGIGDFDVVLAESRRPPKTALLGRARCKQKLGDLAGAQADFDRYRREFPNDSPR
jgi:hypothetical protein